MTAPVALRRFAGPVTVMALVLVAATHLQAQMAAKRVRVSIPGANVTYLPFYAAKDKGYYREEGIEIEFILMPASLASTAVMTGDIDYNGAVTGVVAAAVRGQPIKAVIFTMRSPVQGLMAKPEIRDPVVPIASRRRSLAHRNTPITFWCPRGARALLVWIGQAVGT